MPGTDRVEMLGVPALRALARLTARIARATTPPEICDASIAALRESLGNDRCAVLLFDASAVMRFHAWSGISDTYRAAVEGHTPWRPDALDARAIFVRDAAADPSLAQFASVFEREGIRALGFVPLAGNRGVIGKFMVYWPEPHEPTEEERVALAGIAERVAGGLEHLRVERELRLSRDQLDRDLAAMRRADERQRFLASAGEILTSSLDYEATLQTLAKLAVPAVADWCRIDLLRPDGSCRTIAVEHADADRVGWARQVESRFAHFARRSTLARVIATGASELFEEITDAMLRQRIDDPEYLDLIRQLELGSAMVVPLRAHERTLGTIAFLAGRARPRFDPSDLAFAEDLARRAGLAIDNARLYRDEIEARAREEEVRREAEKANRTKDTFLATISHELRTPLTSILGWSRMLTTIDVDPATLRTGLEAIASSATAQARIIDDLLDVSRIVTGKLRIHVQPVTLASIVEGAVLAIRPSAEAKEIAVEASCDDAAVVLGDPDRLQQIVWNLLSNAVKFTPPRGRIAIAAVASEQTARLTVTDTGPGIAPEVLPYIFERFRQADGSSTRKIGGLGLGLSIVKSLVEAHGGSIATASAQPGPGTTFAVTFPRADAPAAAAIVRPTEPRLDGQRILVVEDELKTREFLTVLLGAAGAEVRSAANVTSALEIAGSWAPSLLISDLAMPERDGDSLVRTLRKRDGSTIPAIALTAHGRPEDRDRAIRSGFTSYIRKPVDPNTLLAELALLLPR